MFLMINVLTMNDECFFLKKINKL